MDRKRNQDQTHLIDIIPHRMVYNARENIALIFNSTLPSVSQGSYNVAFQGRRRERIEVKAKKVNPYTLIVQAPVYNPAEEVRLHVRHVTHEGTKSLGSLPFEFISRDTLMAHLLQGCADPVMFMCEALGISPHDMVTLDKALTASFKTNMPPGFNLLGLRNDGIENDASNSLYPTLLHFASAFGLYHFVKDCLIHCSGFFEAIALQNCRDKRPSEIAYEGQFMNIFELLNSAEISGEEIYEKMDEHNEEDPYYTSVSRQRVINLHLWQDRKESDPSDCDTDPDGYIKTYRTHSEPDEIYTDMESGYDDGYSTTTRSHTEPEEIYTDMDSGADQFETDSGCYRSRELEPECDELYADMDCGAEREDMYEGFPTTQCVEPEDDQDESFYMNETDIKPRLIGKPSSHYQIPSNLPVTRMYPDARSISVSLQSRNDYKPKSTKPKAQPGPPAVPTRMKKPVLPPQSKPVRPVSITSTASGTSSISVDSGISESNYDEEENQFMTLGELLKTMKLKPNEGDSPPPPPPTDYNEQPSISPKPRANRHHQRAKTLPVAQSDVTSAQSLMTSHQSSWKEPRPIISKRTSDLGPGSAGYRSPAPNPERRGSDGSLRQPAPTPQCRGLGGGVPTPFIMAVHEEAEPNLVHESAPPVPKRISSKAPVAPPSPRPRPPPPRH